MSSTGYGRRLHPFRTHQEPQGDGGIRLTHSKLLTPAASAEPGAPLLIQLPQLERDEVLVPGSARLGFDIELESTDENRTVVQNLGQAIVAKQTIFFGSFDVMTIQHSDIFHCYLDLWKTAQERANGVYQGLDTSPNRNVTRLRIGAADAETAGRTADVAVAAVYKKRFSIPLDFEFLECGAPVHQGKTGDRMTTEITFNKPSQVLHADGDKDSTYHIKNIRLEYDIVNIPHLANTIRNQYTNMSINYDRVMWLRCMPHKKEDTIWTEEIKTGSRSLKGVLMLWVDPMGDGQDFKRNTSVFTIPKFQRLRSEWKTRQTSSSSTG